MPKYVYGLCCWVRIAYLKAFFFFWRLSFCGKDHLQASLPFRQSRGETLKHLYCLKSCGWRYFELTDLHKYLHHFPKAIVCGRSDPPGDSGVMPMTGMMHNHNRQASGFVGFRIFSTCQHYQIPCCASIADKRPNNQRNRGILFSLMLLYTEANDTVLEGKKSLMQPFGLLFQ